MQSGVRIGVREVASSQVKTRRLAPEELAAATSGSDDDDGDADGDADGEDAAVSAGPASAFPVAAALHRRSG